MAMSRDNECSYFGKYDTLETIFDRCCHFRVCMENLKSVQVLKWRDKKGEFSGDDGTLITRKDYADGPMVEW